MLVMMKSDSQLIPDKMMPGHLCFFSINKLGLSRGCGNWCDARSAEVKWHHAVDLSVSFSYFVV